MNKRDVAEWSLEQLCAELRKSESIIAAEAAARLEAQANPCARLDAIRSIVSVFADAGIANVYSAETLRLAMLDIQRALEATE